MVLPVSQIVLKGKGATSTYWLEGCDDDMQWQRLRQMNKNSSKESLDTKMSMNALSYSGSPSGGIQMISNQGSSLVSAIQHHHHSSPSNNLTTICVTPAD